MTIEEKLRHYIDNHHFNRSSLARALNVSPATFHQILTGNRNLKADEFIILCREMGLDLNRAVRYDEELKSV